MKKVRSIINIILGSMIAALGLSSCEKHELVPMYGIPNEEIDTTVHCMYGVTPVIISDLNEE